MSIASDIEWFMERLPTPPARLHQRGVWADEDDGLGSELGAPAYTRLFQQWLEHEFTKTTERYEGRPCDHPTLSEAQLLVNREAERRGAPLPFHCATCDGTGRRSGERTEYRWPMRAALARIRGLQPVHRGAPSQHTILFRLAASEGEVARMAEVLMPEYPCMAIRTHVFAHLGNALRKLREKYSETELPRMPRGEPTEKSEAQLNAEVAA